MKKVTEKATIKVKALCRLMAKHRLLISTIFAITREIPIDLVELKSKRIYEVSKELYRVESS